MSDTEAQEINPDDYKCSGKISRLFSRLAGREFRSAEFIVARPHFRKLYSVQLVARERKAGKWDVIEKTTASYFGYYGWNNAGWHDGKIQLEKLHTGVSKEAARQAIASFENEHQPPVDEKQKQNNARKAKLDSLFR